ncbi:MAG: hypothetical protein ABJA57_09175 [Ginsengibacter sp.]
MKNKIWLVLVFMLAGILSLQAQQQGFQKRTIEERVTSTMDKISDSLQLSTPQKTDAANTFSDYYKAMDKMREGMAPGTRPERSDFEKMITERDAKLKIIFTEAQYKKYKEQLEPAMRHSRGDRPQGNN